MFLTEHGIGVQRIIMQIPVDLCVVCERASRQIPGRELAISIKNPQSPVPVSKNANNAGARSNQ